MERRGVKRGERWLGELSDGLKSGGNLLVDKSMLYSHRMPFFTF
jgi:hypothetical protein